jgi:betaine-aldehyde dehydrogenase
MSYYIHPNSLHGYIAKEYMMLIDGAWRKSQSGETSSRLAPGHGTLVGQYQSATVADAKLAILSARKAFDHGPWPRMKAAERAKFLHRVADLIEQNREKIAHLDTIESGNHSTSSK